MQTASVSIAAIICAAGSSSRMGGTKKEYLPLPGNTFTVLGAAVNAFASCKRVDAIIAVVPPGDEESAQAFLPKQNRVLFVPGGPTRRVSVYNALLRLASSKVTHVLIHDGARPWIKSELIERIIDAAIQYGAVIPALPLNETPKELCYAAEKSGGTQFIRRHLRRADVYTAQTPQGFKFPDILEAHKKAAEREIQDHIEYTDDAGIWGEFIGQVAVIPGEKENRKITFPEDIGNTSGIPKEKSMQRIGLGKDFHRLVAGRRFLLGGVEIPFEKGELGHSDGDVLTHAIIDALLGAAGLGDIGELFPSGDPAWKDADSLELLKSAWTKVQNEGWRLVNMDCTVCSEKPKLLPYRERICLSLAQALEVNPAVIFVKGKTNEGLGPLGTGEAVEATAVCLLEKP